MYERQKLFYYCRTQYEITYGIIKWLSKYANERARNIRAYQYNKNYIFLIFVNFVNQLPIGQNINKVNTVEKYNFKYKGANQTAYAR